MGLGGGADVTILGCPAPRSAAARPTPDISEAKRSILGNRSGSAVESPGPLDRAANPPAKLCEKCCAMLTAQRPTCHTTATGRRGGGAR